MKQLLLVQLLIFSFSTFGQNFNRPVPGNQAPYEFQTNGNPLPNGYFMVSPFFAGPSTPYESSIQIIDKEGYIAWIAKEDKVALDLKFHPNHNQYSFTEQRNGNVWHFFMDLNFNLIDSLKIVGPYDGDVHDLILDDLGNRYILGLMDTTMDLSGYTINGGPGNSNTTIISPLLQKIDTAGNLLFHWNGIDHITPDHFVTGYPYNVNGFDYMHPNSIAIDSDGHYLVSMRHGDLVVKINSVTGDLVWKLGGPFSDFTFTNDGGFEGQHFAHRLPNGDIALYDNSVFTMASRGVTYSLDTTNMTATRTSELFHPSGVSSNAMGSYAILDNGYELIGWGNSRRPEPSYTLFEANGAVAAEFFMVDTFVTYRSFFQELPSFPERPLINCTTSGSSVTLSLTGTHSDFQWSTGETTPTITTSTPGWYQCWVKQGIGSIGSIPIEIDANSTCLNLGIEEITLKKEILKLTDLSGREIENPATNQVYFVIYTDGTAERKIQLKE